MGESTSTEEPKGQAVQIRPLAIKLSYKYLNSERQIPSGAKAQYNARLICRTESLCENHKFRPSAAKAAPNRNAIRHG
jgi:hypothetical protein